MALVLLAKEGKLEKEMLFVPEESPSYALWNGYRTTASPEAAAMTGIENVVALSVPRMGSGVSWKPLQEALKSMIDGGATRVLLDNGGDRPPRRR